MAYLINSRQIGWEKDGTGHVDVSDIIDPRDGFPDLIDVKSSRTGAVRKYHRQDPYYDDEGDLMYVVYAPSQGGTLTVYND